MATFVPLIILMNRNGHAVDSDAQARADTRFTEALDRTGARDPRKSYRTMLRELKSQDGDAYEDVVASYESSVVRPVAEGEADPLEAWLEFGRTLAERLHPGRTVVIDETGRARPLEAPASWEQLILHLPDERRAKPVAVGLPPELTRAQRATVDVLALGKVRLPDA